MSSTEEGHTRKPLPAPEEIAKLPNDGGEEFNRLVFEQSPYLLQHARNPVDWWPWSDEAFEKARDEDKPIFLSIGYSTCHWCHVMEHESFEDEEVAELINRFFIPIKVDREERPDIDEVYMAVTQALTGGGGWPMTVLLTPDKDPFFAGTYFPKESIGNRAGIKQVVVQLHKAWAEKRDEVLNTSKEISMHLGNAMGGSPGGELTPAVFERGFLQFVQRYDEKYGGFGSAPKFPVPGNLLFLLRYHDRTGDKNALTMVEQTLTQMRLGGIYDHVGFGIHRYSTTSDWLVPHFEKMLYDQALATLAYVEAYEITGNEFYAKTAGEILSYVQRDMTSEEGGFYSAEDADSEGEEGKFYVWTREEAVEVLGEEDGNFFADTFQFTPEGNFLEEATRERTGTNIPHLAAVPSSGDGERIEKLRKQLYEHREKRIHPLKDDKILTDWNGLMIGAFATAAQGLQNEKYATIARRAADFLLEHLRTEDGRLLKRYRQGEAGLTAHLEDYVFVIWGLLKLYETNFDLTYLQAALELQAVTDEFFLDEEKGGYFMTADDAEKLIVRTKKLYGGAIPGGNAIAIENLSRFYRMTGDRKYAERADELVRAFSGEVEQQPMAYPNVLCGFDFLAGPGYEVVISSPEADTASKEMIAATQKSFRPRTVVLFRTESNAAELAKLAPFTETQVSRDGKPTAYVCREFACKLPVTSISEMLELMEKED